MRRPGWLVVLAVASGSWLGCGTSDHPAPASDAADASAAETGVPTGSRPPSLLDAGSDAGDPTACNACLTTSCKAPIATCSGDPSCTQCFDAFRSACIAKSAFTGVTSCACNACANDCRTNCEGFTCVQCLSQHCATEYDACAGDASCAPCMGPGAPATCSTHPLATALASCSAGACASACK
jgi:hypothetical protein